VISVCELEFGARKSSLQEKNLLSLKKFLTPFRIIEFDHNAAVEYGVIKSNLLSKGTPIGPFDVLIAAHAKSLNYTLVTNNVKEFSRVNGLIVENWV
jgi:tRNA(fMet)-specific endonuclease VapC